MKKVIFIAIGLTGLAITACKKDDNGKPATTTQLLVASSWKIDTVTLDANKDNNPDSQIPAGYIESCDLDNIITFKSDLTGISDEGATKCEDTLPQTTNFSWQLKGNDTLSISGNPLLQLNGDIFIKEITNTSMTLVKNLTITDPITINTNVIVVLKK